MGILKDAKAIIKCGCCIREPESKRALGSVANHHRYCLYRMASTERMKDLIKEEQSFKERQNALIYRLYCYDTIHKRKLLHRMDEMA